MVFTTVYVSTLAAELSEQELAALLAVSRTNNARAGISGLLVVDGRRVMQLLEGDESAVQALFARIADDRRHNDVVRVWSSTGRHRRFADWSMGFDDSRSASDLQSPGGFWVAPTPPGAAEPTVDLTDEVARYVLRRAAVLRRALVSDSPLVSGLAVILRSHRPESALGDDGVVRYRCIECRGVSTETSDQYPCATAESAIWALESV